MKLPKDIRLLSIKDKDYPALLREIHDPPKELYVKGVLPKSSLPHVAVVGSRIASHYGVRTSRILSADLAAQGVVVVSGMALGIDTAAHEGALSVGGITIAVLGSGFSNLYPPENKRLAEQIVEKGGAVITEFPMEAEPEPFHFPLRNRIISGLSHGTLVVEARRKSGALITADLALEQGREVFAVPGNVDSTKSDGTNWLLKQGAKLTMSAEDILEELNIKRVSQERFVQKNEADEKDLSDEEKKLLSLFDSEPLHVDTLVESSRLAPPQAISALSLLEIKGRLKQLPGKNFVRIR